MTDEATDGDRARDDDGRVRSGDDRSRSVVARAVGYAVLRADSWTLRTYALIALLGSAFVTVLVLLAVPTWMLAAEGGPIERIAVAFLVLLGLGFVALALAPVLFVDRRRRSGRPERQRAHGLAGYGYLLAAFLGLVASAPADARSDPSGALAPVVDALYALPRAAGLAFLLAGVALVLGVEYGLDGQRAS